MSSGQDSASAAISCSTAAISGVNLESPSADDVKRTWEVIRSFAAEPVEDDEPRDQDGDGILAQYGTYDWGEGERFEPDMTRQLRALGDDNLWSFDLSLNRFFERALALPGLRGVRELAVRPKRLVVEYGDV